MMAKIIKLENLRSTYDRDTGSLIIQEIIEFVCEACRHLVNQDDKFCWQCGEPLEKSSKVEHYYKGEKLTNTKFREVEAQK